MKSDHESTSASPGKLDQPLQRYDLSALTDAGLRRGYTTGSCATAAVKAALLALLCNECPEVVNVSLPDGLHFLRIPIDHVRREPASAAYAEVIKDGGDDPDQTHRAAIFARVQRNNLGSIVFQRGEGVGVVTQPGLQVAIGEPAINPVPRKMMSTAVQEVLAKVIGRLMPVLISRLVVRMANRLPGAPLTRASGSLGEYRFWEPPGSLNQNRWRLFRRRFRSTSGLLLETHRMRSFWRLAILASASPETRWESRRNGSCRCRILLGYRWSTCNRR